MVTENNFTYVHTVNTTSEDSPKYDWQHHYPQIHAEQKVHDAQELLSTL